MMSTCSLVSPTLQLSDSLSNLTVAPTPRILLEARQYLLWFVDTGRPPAIVDSATRSIVFVNDSCIVCRCRRHQASAVQVSLSLNSIEFIETGQSLIYVTPAHMTYLDPDIAEARGTLSYQSTALVFPVRQRWSVIQCGGGTGTNERNLRDFCFSDLPCSQ